MAKYIQYEVEKNEIHPTINRLINEIGEGKIISVHVDYYDRIMWFKKIKITIHFKDNN